MPPQPQTTDLRRFRSGYHSAVRRYKNLINRWEETTCRLCDTEEESYDHFWLRCPAFDADGQRLNLGASLDELIRLPAKAQALLRIILRRLRWITTTKTSPPQNLSPPWWVALVYIFVFWHKWQNHLINLQAFSLMKNKISAENTSWQNKTAFGNDLN